MAAANPLLGAQATPHIEAGYASGDLSDDYSNDQKSRDADDDFCSLKVGAIMLGAVLFVVLLRKGGMRDMVTT
jgi:hypothetical protein